MVIKKIQNILGEIFLKCLESPEGVNKKIFRAKNRKHIDTLDFMEEHLYLEYSRDVYFIKTGSLPIIKETVSEVEMVIIHGNQIFKILDKEYEKNQDQEISVNRIADLTRASQKRTAVTLKYLIQTAIIGAYSTDLEHNSANVKPSESVLKFRSFDEIIEIEYNRLQKHNEPPQNEEIVESDLDHPIESFEQLLHPRIEEVALQQYYNRYLRDAVLNSVLAVFDLIRHKTGLKTDGDKLVGEAFSTKKPYLIVGDLSSDSGLNDQKGFMQILKGLYQGVRSPQAHTLDNDLTYLSAAQYLILSSLSARRIEEAELVKEE